MSSIAFHSTILVNHVHLNSPLPKSCTLKGKCIHRPVTKITFSCLCIANSSLWHKAVFFCLFFYLKWGFLYFPQNHTMVTFFWYFSALLCTTPSLFYHIFWYLKCFVAKVAYSHAAPSSPSHAIYLQDRAGLVREWETGWAFCCEATALTTAPPKT